MREPAFLRKNKDKWLEYEQLLTQSASSATDPDRLAELYVQLTDDLAYARTFYPRSQTVKYLNGLAARTHLQIYQNKRSKKQRLLSFWTEELPEILADSRKELLYAFGIFTFVFIIGILAALNGDTFIRSVLGDRYVNMTIENIKDGDPMGVYKRQPSLPMFLEIAVNNIRVSFFAFAAGMFLSVGTMYVLFNNGLMLGAFFGLFHLHGNLWEALPVIYIHGTLELSAIVIAGAAGIKLGNSILFPGTLTRRQSLQSEAKKGVKIIVGLIPVFLLAAWLEGYVTRLTAWPLAAKLMIILMSLCFIVGYYLVYPYLWKKRQQGLSISLPSSADQHWLEMQQS
ncbi:MAG: stage II sporulation protein M [Bacteroidia bacterium]|nr:stage II sporulation protein M [Bacteroidia bacterium]